MSRKLTAALALLIGLASTSIVLALGGDYSRMELAQRGELVEGQTPVHGYWVNGEDAFFYSGHTAELNRFLEAYGKLTELKRRVVIHPGTRNTRSPWDESEGEIPTDWSFYRSNARSAEDPKFAPTRVDIWLGTRIKLEDLQVPADVEVVSGDEIEKFVERHQKRAAKTLPPDEAVRHAGQEFVRVEFDVASAVWSLAPRPPRQPRGPVKLEMGENLKNGGQFYIMLWGKAVGSNEDLRTKEFKSQRVRAVGRIQVANPESASTDYYMTIYDAADIVVVK